MNMEWMEILMTKKERVFHLAKYAWNKKTKKITPILHMIVLKT